MESFVGHSQLPLLVRVFAGCVSVFAAGCLDIEVAASADTPFDFSHVREASSVERFEMLGALDAAFGHHEASALRAACARLALSLDAASAQVLLTSGRRDRVLIVGRGEPGTRRCRHAIMLVLGAARAAVQWATVALAAHPNDHVQRRAAEAGDILVMTFDRKAPSDVQVADYRAALAPAAERLGFVSGSRPAEAKQASAESASVTTGSGLSVMLGTWPRSTPLDRYWSIVADLNVAVAEVVELDEAGGQAAVVNAVHAATVDDDSSVSRTADIAALANVVALEGGLYDGYFGDLHREDERQPSPGEALGQRRTLPPRINLGLSWDFVVRGEGQGEKTVSEKCFMQVGRAFIAFGQYLGQSFELTGQGSTSPFGLPECGPCERYGSHDTAAGLNALEACELSTIFRVAGVDALWGDGDPGEEAARLREQVRRACAIAAPYLQTKQPVDDCPN